MVKLNSPDYFHDTSILRAKQSWQQESKVEQELSVEFQLFLEKLKEIVAELYAAHGHDGLIHYADLQRRLTPSERNAYERMIQEVINQHANQLTNSEREEMERIQNERDLNVLDARVGLLEVYLLLTFTNTSEMLSESLSHTYNYIYDHTIYDLHRKRGYVSPFERKNQQVRSETILSDWSGDTYEDALRHRRLTLQRDLKRTIVKGIRRNESYQKLLRGLTKAVSGGKGYKGIRNILRGETARVIAETTAQGYEQVGVKQYQFIATLDNRTTEICKNMDGRVFNLKDIEVGVNCNPMHFGCRSTISAYFPEDDLSEWQRTARNPNTGRNYKVEGNITFHEWNERYNK